MAAVLSFSHVMHDLTTLHTAELSLGIQNYSQRCASVWFYPACNILWWKLAIRSWTTWCSGGTIIGYLPSNAIGASTMQTPTLMTPSPNMGGSITILLECFTLLHVSRSFISSAYTSPCTSFTMVTVSLSKSAVVMYFSVFAFLSGTFWIAAARPCFVGALSKRSTSQGASQFLRKNQSEYRPFGQSSCGC